MELTVDMGIREIVNFLNRLPANQIAKIKQHQLHDYLFSAIANLIRRYVRDGQEHDTT